MASIWNGTSWASHVVGEALCSPGDVAVSDNGALAAIALNCNDGARVALYRAGTWSVSPIAGSAPTLDPRIAVSGDGSSAVVAWGEASGIFAATYR